MTKTLSEQLCEIVGLPYKKTEIDYRIQDSDGDFCEEYIYTLDFEQPENFVKLWELKIKHPITEEIFSLCNWRLEYDGRKTFLQNLICKLNLWCSKELSCGFRVEVANQIKQSIRDYDGWVWR